MNGIHERLARSRCWAEISGANLRHNIREVKKHIPASSALLAVVKADAYGHGAVYVARIALEEGAAYLAVACLSEAAVLREAGIEAPILILSSSPWEETEFLCREGLSQTVSSLEEARRYAERAAEISSRPRVHIKVDSGMGRLGFSVREEDQEKTLQDILEIASWKLLEIEGIFTHFATAADADHRYQELQFKRFQAIIDRLRQSGLSIRLCHCANSASILNAPQMALDMVRAGIVLYGGRDGDFMLDCVDLRPVMTLKARVSQIRELAAGESVSYGRIWTAPQPCRIAVVEAGYADGVPRRLSNKAIFSWQGMKLNQVGCICMDRCMLDATEAREMRVGDTVVFFGGEGADSIDAEAQAQRAGTISYELFCQVSPRVPRLYDRMAE